MLLEICAGSLYSALAGQAGGADRIELCDNLEQGGTTPSPGIIKQAVKLLEIPVFVLVRPRPGDFLYSEEEFQAMKEDILFCKAHDVKGVVLGILDRKGHIDLERTAELVELARPMQVTFHRAFDRAADPFRALEEIISLGIERILTSGQMNTAMEGSALIRELIRKSAQRIVIMPGSGINEGNVADLISITGAEEVHASLRSQVENRSPGTMDPTGNSIKDEYFRMETDPKKVMKVKQLINNP